MHLDEALRQREPETGPSCCLLDTGLGLLELLEDPVEILGGDARAGVGTETLTSPLACVAVTSDQPARAA